MTPYQNNMNSMRCPCHQTPRPSFRAAPEPVSRQPRRTEVSSPSNCRSNKNDPLSGMPVAMAYVPWQTWQNIYDARKGFQCGTIFQDLNKPFRGKGGVCL